jgi:hypothetical protein
MHFTILSKKATLLKFPFFSQVPGQIEKFAYMPLDGRKAPRKIKTLAMRPLALGRWRPRPIPGESAVLPGGEECREVCGLTLGRFVPRVGAKGQPAEVHVDAKRRRPRWPQLRREGRTTRARCIAVRSTG